MWYLYRSAKNLSKCKANFESYRLLELAKIHEELESAYDNYSLYV